VPQTEKPTSRKRAAVFLKAAFQALHEAGGSLRLGEIKKAVRERVALTESDREVYEKTGYVRWESVLHFYSIDCVKAGYIRKHSGLWHLTPEGEATLQEPAEEVLERAQRAYRKWKSTQENVAVIAESEKTSEAVEQDALEKTSIAIDKSFVFETAEAQARKEIEEEVLSFNPYEFQDFVAALLRGMGFSTPLVAGPGRDGGTDILAYPDPLGTQKPHIRVQVKHRSSQKATRDEIAALRGIIRQDREIGLFVSTAGFTPDAVREARHGGSHIELMTLDQILDHWVSFYDKLSETDRAYLQLRRVYFLAPT
jgi:restriction system protein